MPNLLSLIISPRRIQSKHAGEPSTNKKVVVVMEPKNTSLPPFTVKKRFGYSKEAFKEATRVIREEKEPINSVSKRFGIPYATLYQKVKQNCDFVIKSGPKQLLSKAAEAELYEFIKKCQKLSVPRSRQQIMQDAWLLATKNGQPHAFGVDGPTTGWLLRFLGRHPDLVLRKAEALSKAAACVNANDVKAWFTAIEKELTETFGADILNDPERLFNMDESGFCICPEKGSIICESGASDVTYIQNTKEQMTAAFTFRANGEVMKPFVLFKGRRLTKQLKEVSSEVHVELNDSGWMTQKSFAKFLEIFNKELEMKKVKKPVILFLDGHTSHDSLEGTKIARAMDIILVRFPANCTQWIQPADKACFGPIKKRYKQIVYNHQANNSHSNLDKATFTHIMAMIKRDFNPQNAVNGFRACGLYPFNFDAVRFPEAMQAEVSLVFSLFFIFFIN